MAAVAVEVATKAATAATAASACARKNLNYINQYNFLKQFAAAA